MFGETFVLNPMFTFFAVQTQLHFSTVANYENNLPPNVGLRPDGGLCIELCIGNNATLWLQYLYLK